MKHFRKKTVFPIAAVVVFLVLAEVIYQVAKPSKTTYSLTLDDLIHANGETNGESGGGGTDGENGGGTGGNNGNTRRCCSFWRSGRCNTKTLTDRIRCPRIRIYVRRYMRNGREIGVGVSTDEVSFTMRSGRSTSTYMSSNYLRPSFRSEIVTCPTNGDCNKCQPSDPCGPF